MSIEVLPLTPVIGAEVRGVDLSAPLDGASFAAIHAAWLDRAILLFRGQERMTPADQLRLSALFGEVDLPDTPDYTLPGFPLIAVVSNVIENGRPIGAPNAGRHWHSDSQYLKEPPSASLLLAREVPPLEGDTGFASSYAAYEGLDETTRGLVDGLSVNYSRIGAYAKFHPERPPLTEAEKAMVPDVVHPLVRVHPETGRRALYVGGVQHGGSIVGMDQEASEARLAALRRHATRPEYVYIHHWKAGDLMIWDNRCAMHCAMPFDEVAYRRTMHRTQVKGGPV